VRERTQVVIEESFPVPVQTSVMIAEKEQRNSPRARGWAWVILTAILAVAGIGVAGARFWKKAHPAEEQQQDDTASTQTSTSAIGAVAHRRSIAVLGFRNLSGSPEEAWLSTALAEMLSTELVAGERLRLISGEDIEPNWNFVWPTPTASRGIRCPGCTGIWIAT
jgi:hypothetical protein